MEGTLQPFGIRLIAIAMLIFAGCATVKKDCDLNYFNNDYLYKNIPTGKAKNLAGVRTQSEKVFKKNYEKYPLFLKNKEIYLFSEVATSYLV